MARQTAQQRKLDALIATLEPQIAKAFREAMARAVNAIDYRALVAALDARDVERAIQLLRIDQGLLAPLLEAQRGAILAGGALATEVLPIGIRAGFGFNGRHPRAEQIIARVGADLLTNIQGPEEIEAAREVIFRGMTENRGAQTVARDLVGRKNAVGVRVGGVVGLDLPRTRIAARVKEILSDPDQIAEYFKRDAEGNLTPRYKTTDRRFDPMVKRAIKAGKPLSAADLDKVTTQHRARLLADRGKTISKHEAFTGQAIGREEAFAQMIEGGKVEAVLRQWSHNFSREPREDHLALNGKTIGFNEFFVMGDGTRMKHPHDPAGGIRNSAGCRCSLIYRPVFAKD